MKNATMLYKSPGPHEIHGGKFDYIIVDECDIGQAKADGWFLTTPEAKLAAELPAAPVDALPTRDEIEVKARELGIAFDGRTSNKTLLAKIDEALKS